MYRWLGHLVIMHRRVAGSLVGLASLLLVAAAFTPAAAKTVQDSPSNRASGALDAGMGLACPKTDLQAATFSDEGLGVHVEIHTAALDGLCPGETPDHRFLEALHYVTEEGGTEYQKIVRIVFSYDTGALDEVTVRTTSCAEGTCWTSFPTAPQDVDEAAGAVTVRIGDEELREVFLQAGMDACPDTCPPVTINRVPSPLEAPLLVPTPPVGIGTFHPHPHYFLYPDRMPDSGTFAYDAS